MAVAGAFLADRQAERRTASGTVSPEEKAADAPDKKPAPARS